MNDSAFMKPLNFDGVVQAVVDRHMEDASFTWLQRDAAIAEPHYDLSDLVELDGRLAAQLDGLFVAGDVGSDVAGEALKIGEPGEVFAAAWLAVARDDGKRLDEVIGAAKDEESNSRALASALAWHSPEAISGWVNSFLKANDPIHQLLGLRTCALHRIDLGAALAPMLASSYEPLVTRSLRAIGELGRKDLLGALKPFQSSDVGAYSFWATWSAVLLGDKSEIAPLKFHVLNNTINAERALQLLCAIMPSGELTTMLQTLAKNPETARLAMFGAGASGDPFWVPGLLKYMDNPNLARVAGQSVSMITGLDLAYLDLDGERPEGFESGPTEDPNDENVELDGDMDLPWPNQQLLTQWWRDNEQNYSAGSRYLCGNPITLENCVNVLSAGYQRQRSAAALELALMGKPYFETRAPGRRQKTLLENFSL